jgi:hypothetical protein
VYPTTVAVTPGRALINSSIPQKQPPASIAFSLVMSAFLQDLEDQL